MSRAFSLLGRGGAVVRDDYERVMKVLRPEYGPQLVDILWRVLDPRGTGLLGTSLGAEAAPDVLHGLTVGTAVMSSKSLDHFG